MLAPNRSPSRTRTIHYLRPDELKTLLGVIDDKRNKAIFLVAYRFCGGGKPIDLDAIVAELTLA